MLNFFFSLLSLLYKNLKGEMTKMCHFLKRTFDDIKINIYWYEGDMLCCRF